MKWSKLKKFQLSTAIASLVALLSYFFRYINLNFGFFEDEIGSIFDLVKEAFSTAESFGLDIGDAIGEVVGELVSDLSIDITDSILKVICVLILLFVVPIVLDIISAVFGFVFFSKGETSKRPYIIGIIAAGYTMVTEVVFSAMLGKFKSEMEANLFDSFDLLSFGFGFYLQAIACISIVVVSILAIMAISNQGERGIVGVKGMWASAEFFNKAGEPLIIGRDAKQCNIIISTNAEKVSRKHCSVIFDGSSDTYMVTDFSSNGTYVEGRAERLAPNKATRLPAGTIINLGDDTNTFRLN